MVKGFAKAQKLKFWRITPSLGSTMRGGDYPLIIPTRSGYHTAQAINRWLLEKYLPERFPESAKEFKDEPPDLWVPAEVCVFADTSSKVRINRHIRGRDVYIISDPFSCATPLQSFDKRKRKTHTYKLEYEAMRMEGGNGHKFVDLEGKISMDANIMEVLRFCDIAQESITRRGFLNVVFPCLPYARQDNRNGRESLDLQNIAIQLEAMIVDYVMAVDVHNPSATKNAFRHPTKFDNLNGTYTLVNHIRSHPETYPLDNLAFVAPDGNALNETVKFAKALEKGDCPIGALLKPERDPDKPNEIEEAYGFVGTKKDFVGRDCIIKDDMIDTGGTAIAGAASLMEWGAKSVIFVMTHAVLSPPALERLDEAYEKGVFKRLLISDTVKQPDYVYEREYVDKTTMMKLLAKAIDHQHYEESISGLLTG